MTLGRLGKYLRLICAVSLLTTCGIVAASEYHGQVTFAGLPVPGATVTATQNDKKFVAVTDQQGVFSFPDLTSGTWTIQVEMSGFSTIKDQVAVGSNTPPAPPWELKMLPLDQMKAEMMTESPAPAAAVPQPKTEEAKAPAASETAKQSEKAKPQENKAQAAGAAAPAPAEETDQRAADGFLINGSQNNGAASPFAQFAAFGNNRPGGRGLYNGGVGVIINNSALDANQYSLSGVNTAKPAFNQITGLFSFGGPLKIPHVWKNGPTFNVQYQLTRNGNDSTLPALVPTMAERGGDLSAVPTPIINPATNMPFTNNMVPVSSQAAALLNLYPMPNLTGNSRYNYQIPVISNMHQDSMTSRFSKQLNRKDSLFGGYSFSSTRTNSPNVFGFLDSRSVLGQRVNVSWFHRFNQRFSQNLIFEYSRSATTAVPYWDNRTNVSGNAGITGNDQDPTNWGPPTLSFSSGITGLSDGLAAHNRNQTVSVGDQYQWRYKLHIFSFGGDFRRQEFNYLAQTNPRGTFSFTGAASGSDLADFLLGIPDASSIAFGNADKYFRQSVYDAYFNDEWKVNPRLSLTLGIRWEYGAPITELFGRLVNLDITPTFSAEAPVLANHPVGAVTGQTYPSSLIRPDKRGVEPNLGLAWRPISGSSIVIRAGYSLRFDTSVYQSIALQMAQQAPLSTSASLQNSATCPLTLAVGFNTCPSTTPDNYSIDPNFRVGYLQTWNASLQKDLPWSLQMTATYLGNKGTRGLQEFLPNTYPIGETTPCPSCPVGFTYLTSNGNSNRESGSINVRRRLHNGLTATVQYVYSKSIDDDSALGGQQTASSFPIAQNWLNLKGERGLSTFDQRHLMTASLQYTTGMGLGGKSLMSGWKGTLYKEWTIQIPITVGSGLPLTPIYEVAVPGTGLTNVIRPNLTGAPIYSAPAGYFLNANAYTAPVSGQWGTAGRDSITGPAQFSLATSMVRTFRLHDRYNLDVQFQATNILNHVTYTSWYTTITKSTTPNTLFGTPTAANQMRNVLTTLRLRF